MPAKYLFTLLFLFIGNLGFAKSAFSPALLKTVDKYRAASLVTMKVDKSVKSELLGTEKKYEGTISLAGDKFRLETETPDKALLLFDGKTIWNVQYPPKELGGSVQVLKSAVTKQNRAQILLSALLDKASLQKNFKVLKEEKDQKTQNQMRITVAPQTSDLTVKSVDLVVDTKKNTLTVVAYTDEVGNLTTMSFSDVEFSKKAKPQIFKYNPPADAQVTNL